MNIPLESNLRRWKQKRQLRGTVLAGDQFDRFQDWEMDEIDIPDILQYWLEKAKSPHWLDIATMAITIHSIPAMSAEVEQVFSRYW